MPQCHEGCDGRALETTEPSQVYSPQHLKVLFREPHSPKVSYEVWHYQDQPLTSLQQQIANRLLRFYFPVTAVSSASERVLVLDQDGCQIQSKEDIAGAHQVLWAIDN